MMKRAILFGAAAALLFAGPLGAHERKAAPTSPEAVDHARVCARGNGQDTIDACNFMIHTVNQSYSDRAVSFVNRGVAYQLQGFYDHALFDYNQAVMLWPEYAVAFYDRASAFDMLGRHQEALENYNEAISLQPEYARAILSRGMTYEDMGKLDSALADYNAYTRLRPDDPQVLNNRGLVYFRLANYAAAIADFSTVLAANPNVPGALYVRGIARLKSGDTSGNADIAAATSFDPAIAAKYATIGVRP